MHRWKQGPIINLPWKPFTKIATRPWFMPWHNNQDLFHALPPKKQCYFLYRGELPERVCSIMRTNLVMKWWAKIHPCSPLAETEVPTRCCKFRLSCQLFWPCGAARPVTSWRPRQLTPRSGRRCSNGKEKASCKIYLSGQRQQRVAFWSRDRGNCIFRFDIWSLCIAKRDWNPCLLLLDNTLWQNWAQFGGKIAIIILSAWIQFCYHRPWLYLTTWRRRRTKENSYYCGRRYVFPCYIVIYLCHCGIRDGKINSKEMNSWLHFSMFITCMMMVRWRA